MYIRTVVYYDIIPLLSLVSSCLTLTVHTIGRLYQVIPHDKKIVPSSTGSTDDFSDKGGAPAQKTQTQKNPHPLQFIPGHDNNREVEVKSLDQEKIGVGGKFLPDVIVDSQDDLNDEKLNKRSSFQEMIEQI